MKQTLVIIGILFSFQSFSQKIKEFDIDLWHKDIIKVAGNYLIQAEKYTHSTPRYKTEYYYSNNPSKKFTIKKNAEIIKIEENEHSYFSLLRTDSCVELLRSPKTGAIWTRILKTDENSEYFKLIVHHDSIIILSNNKIYHNLKDKNFFEVYNISDFKCSKIDGILSERNIVSHDSHYCFVDKTIYIGNDFGEWGGNFLAIKYNPETNKFSCQNLPIGNVRKIIRQKNSIYVLELLQHIWSTYNTVYKITGTKIDTIFSQNGSEFNPELRDIKCMKDSFGWAATVKTLPILSLENDRENIYMMIEKKGIYKLDKNNGLKFFKAFPIDKTIYTSNEIGLSGRLQPKDFRIIDNTFFIINQFSVLSIAK